MLSGGARTEVRRRRSVVGEVLYRHANNSGREPGRAVRNALGARAPRRFGGPKEGWRFHACALGIDDREEQSHSRRDSAVDRGWARRTHQKPHVTDLSGAALGGRICTQ